jgi:hypothetical protein
LLPLAGKTATIAALSQAPVRMSDASVRPRSAQHRGLTSIEKQQQSPPKMMASAKGCDDERGASLAFTAGDLCAQLGVLSRPMHQCDSLVDTAGGHFQGNRDDVYSAAAASQHKQPCLVPSVQQSLQPSRHFASSALARLGSASRNSLETSRVKVSSGDGCSANLNKLFRFGNETLPSKGKEQAVPIVESVEVACAAAVSITDEQRPSTEFLAAIIDGDAEVLDVWIDETDSTTGSCNSTGLAARDVLRLSALAHSCTNSDPPHTAAQEVI